MKFLNDKYTKDTILAISTMKQFIYFLAAITASIASAAALPEPWLKLLFVAVCIALTIIVPLLCYYNSAWNIELEERKELTKKLEAPSYIKELGMLWDRDDIYPVCNNCNKRLTNFLGGTGGHYFKCCSNTCAEIPHPIYLHGQEITLEVARKYIQEKHNVIITRQ